MTARSTLAMALIVTVPVWGTPTTETAATAVGQTAGPTVQQPGSGMQNMMKMHEQMMAEMKANRARLDALTNEMNNASPGAKMDAIAAVVTELVRQQTAMYERMGQMHEQMMSGRGMMEGRSMGH